MITFQINGFHFPEGGKTFLGSNTYKRLLKRFTSQKGRKGIYNYTFSKVNALSKERSGAYSQEKCLKLSDAEGKHQVHLDQYKLKISK